MFREVAARGTDAPWYKGWEITEEARDTFRATTIASQQAKRRAVSGECSGRFDAAECAAWQPGWKPVLLGDSAISGVSIIVDSPNAHTSTGKISIKDPRQHFAHQDMLNGSLMKGYTLSFYVQPSRPPPRGLTLGAGQCSVEVIGRDISLSTS